MLIKSNIEVSYEVIALLTGTLGRNAIAPLLPCKHRFADVNTPIIYDIGLHHSLAVGCKDAGKAIPQQIVADMPQVQRLIGIGGRVLYHYKRRLLCNGGMPPCTVAINRTQKLKPKSRREAQV